MPILMEKILREVADQAYESLRLGRNDVHAAREWVFVNTLVELEAAGDAMRYLNCHGQIAWKTTPQFREHLMDLLFDTEADLEDF